MSAAPWSSPHTPLTLYTDSYSMVVNVLAPRTATSLSQRRLLDIADMRELARDGDLSDLVAVSGQTNPADCLTNNQPKANETRLLLRALLRSGSYTPQRQC